MNKLERFATIGIVTSAMIASYMPNVLAQTEGENPPVDEVIQEPQDDLLDDQSVDEKEDIVDPIDVYDEDDDPIEEVKPFDQKEFYDDPIHALAEIDEEENKEYLKDEEGNILEGEHGEHFVKLREIGNYRIESTDYNFEMAAYELTIVIPDDYFEAYVQGDIVIDFEDLSDAAVYGEDEPMLRALPDGEDTAEDIPEEHAKHEDYKWISSEWNGRLIIQIKSETGHTYQYKDGSLDIKPDGLVYAGEMNDIRSGEKEANNDSLKALYVALSEPLEALLGDDIDNVSTGVWSYGYDETDIIKEKLAAIDASGETTLMDYILEFYSKKYGTTYTNTTDLINAHGKEFLENLGDGHATMSTDPYKDEALLKAYYDYVYDELFVACVDELYNSGSEEPTYGTFEDYLADKNPELKLTINEYVKKDSDAYKYANAHFKKMLYLGKDVKDAADATIQWMMGFNAEKLGSMGIFDGLMAGYDAKITLEQVDGSVAIKVSDENNEISDGTFNLYYVNVEENGKRMYYTFDEDGRVTYTADKSLAAAIITSEGEATVNYLLPNTYYLTELLDPETHELSEEAIAFAIKKGTITEVEIKKDETKIDPVNPDIPTPVIIIPITPSTPEVVPVQEVEEEVTPEGPAAEEVIEEETPALADTGTVSTTFFYGLGSMLVALGTAIRRKLHK